jgi:ABC-2 type transport system permease protein
MGVFIFALGQAPRYLPAQQVAGFWKSLLPSVNGLGLSSLFGRGMLGEPWPLAASLACAVLLFLAVWIVLGASFASGAISAAAYRPAGDAQAQGGAFRASPFPAVFMKNLRLLARFPGIVSQTVYRSLTLVPVVMILAGRIHNGTVQAVVPLLVFLTGQLALFFISVMIGSDESPELAASAPVAANFLRRGSLAAAGYATLMLMVPPLFGVLLRAGALLPVLTAGMACVLVSNLALGFKMPIPLIKAEFGKAGNGTLMGLVLGVGVSSAWSLAAWLLVAPHPFAWLFAK